MTRPVSGRSTLQPRWPLVWLLAVTTLAAAVSAWLRVPAPWYLLLLAVPLQDLLRAGRDPPPRLQRDLPGHLAVDREAAVRLTLTSTAARAVVVEVRDDAPSDGDPAPMLAGRLEAGGGLQFTYRLCPRRRGPLHLSDCRVRLRSPQGFWWRTWTLPLASSSRVYPDFVRVEGYRLMAMEQRRNQMGVRLQQRRGEGSEFHQLRDYRDGDSLRQVDWNATARRHRLISREYQDDRDQQLVLMLDAGRRMLARDGELSFFDRCLNGLLMLSHVALGEGDSVAMMCFAASQRLLPAVKGPGALNRLLNHFYDLYPTSEASDYLAAAALLSERFPRRALVVLATSLRDSDTDEILAAWRLLSRKHRVILADLRDPQLDAHARQPVARFAQALHYVGAQELLRQRARVRQRLHAEGILVLDCTPLQLSAMLVNTYLAIKRSGSL